MSANAAITAAIAGALISNSNATLEERKRDHEKWLLYHTQLNQDLAEGKISEEDYRDILGV